MIEGIIFDLDGTLLYTLKDLNNAINFSLLKNGFNSISLDETKSFIGNGVEKLVLRSLKNQNEDKFESVLKDFKDYYDKHNCDNTYPYDGIIELLKKLNEKNIKIAIVSNKYQKGVEEICKPLFDKYIKVYVGASKNYKSKPEVDMVNIALNKMNVSSNNCLFVGDSIVDILTAKNANMKSIGVLWGYKDVSLATYKVSNPLEIITIIDKENKND